MKLIKQWWRIKSASMWYNSITPSPTLDFQKIVKDIIKWKNQNINTWFFPKIWSSLRTSLNRQPLRPIISTHQWMPWKLLPFLYKW